MRPKIRHIKFEEIDVNLLDHQFSGVLRSMARLHKLKSKLLPGKPLLQSEFKKINQCLEDYVDKSNQAWEVVNARVEDAPKEFLEYQVYMKAVMKTCYPIANRIISGIKSRYRDQYIF